MQTCHTKSVITKPQNVCVMRDIMCSGYVAGGNTRWFGAPPNNIFAANTPATDDDVVTQMAQRLSFEDDATGEYASMVAFASPLADEMASSRDQVISSTDRLLPWEVSKNAPAEKSYFPGGNTGYQTYRQKWNLASVHFGEDVRATENMSFMSQVSAANSNPPRAYTHTHTHKRCRLLTTQNLWLTPMLSRAGRRQQRPLLPRPAPQVQPVRTELLRARAGPGPLRPRRHPRGTPPAPFLAIHHCHARTRRQTPTEVPTAPSLLRLQDARWRRGESVSLKSARDSMVSLEVAAHSQLAMRPANGI